MDTAPRQVAHARPGPGVDAHSTGRPPREGAYAVATVRWAELGTLDAGHLDLIDAAEGRRRDSFVNPCDRDRFTLGAVLTRLVLAEHLGADPADLPVRRACHSCEVEHGPPSVPGSGIEVSVSHSGEVVVVATTRAGPIGVDVELCRAIPFQELMPDLVAAGEATPGDLRQFYALWTAKESYLKALGTGLSEPMTNVLLSDALEPPRLIAHGGRYPAATMTVLNPPDGYIACLTVLGTGPVLVDEAVAGTSLGDYARS